MTIGDRIKSVRGSLSRDKFALQTCISKSSLVNYETGERTPPSDYLVKILELYSNVSPAWLLMGEGEMERGKFTGSLSSRSELNTGFQDGLSCLPLFVFIMEAIDEIEEEFNVKFTSEEKALKLLMTYLEFIKEGDNETMIVEADSRVIKNFIGLLGWYQESSKMPLGELEEDKLETVLKYFREVSKGEELEFGFMKKESNLPKTR